MEVPDWESIFTHPVISFEKVAGGYTNEIWHVETAKGDYVVKITHNPPRPDRPFWDGLYHLFGLNVYNTIRHRQQLADFIREHTPLMVPQIYHVDRADKEIRQPYLVAERLPGAPLNLEEGNNGKGLVEQLGEHLGSLHRAVFSYWGCFPGAPRFEPASWSFRLAKTVAHMADKWFQDNEAVQACRDHFIAQARALPTPQSFSLIFPDFHMDQFLERDNQLWALIDIESQVLGPRELDFVALEYVLPAHLVAPFVEGYEKHLPIPDLSPVRPLYRFLYYLIEALGESGFDEWMNSPIRFG